MIIVTGASRGLGRAISARLTEKGLNVGGIARDVSSCSGKVYACDISSYDQVKAVVRQLKTSGVKLEGLVNAAGIASMNLAVTTPSGTTAQIINTNLLGTIYCCQLFGPMLARQKRGSIVNFSTIAVALGLKGESIYAASKAGVEGFSRAFAREMADFNVTVNCIAPGPISTDLIKGVAPHLIENIVRQQIIPKQFGVDAVCDIVEILLDPKSASLSGQVFHIGGA